MSVRRFVFVFLLILPVLLQNCAQVAQPPGGKKDTLAPKLVSSLPKQRQLNYAGKTVELEFDEYVNSENLQQKVTITPQDSNTFIVKSLPWCCPSCQQWNTIKPMPDLVMKTSG